MFVFPNPSWDRSLEILRQRLEPPLPRRRRSGGKRRVLLGRLVTHSSAGWVLLCINALPAEAFACLVGHLNQCASDEELPLLSVDGPSDQMWMAKQAH